MGMKIMLSPVRGDKPIVLEKQGDTIIVNGEVFDFSPLPDGATLPRDAVACDHLASDVQRVGGVLRLTLRLPHGPNAPEETRFAAPITVVEDGPITLPPYDAAVDDLEAEGEA